MYLHFRNQGRGIINYKSWVMNHCYRKTAVCDGDQLLDFSAPELGRSQSTFSIDPKVLQNCASFTLCSSAGLAVSDCAAVMGLTPCMLCVQIYCVLCVLDHCLLNSQLWVQDWVGLCFGNLCRCWVLQGWISDMGIDGPTFVPKSGYFLLIWVKVCPQKLAFS